MFYLGLVTIIPVFLVIELSEWALNSIGDIIALDWSPPALESLKVLGVKILVAIFVIYIMGVLASFATGERIIVYLWKSLEKIPVVGKFLNPMRSTVREAFNAFNRADMVFRETVLVGPEGHQEIGFLTSEEHLINGNRKYSVYIPGVPVPTSGKLIFANENEFTVVNLDRHAAVNTLTTMGVTKIRT